MKARVPAGYFISAAEALTILVGFRVKEKNKEATRKSDSIFYENLRGALEFGFITPPVF